VRLAVDTAFIDKWTAAAWGVNNTIPVIVEILFTWQYLNDRRMPPKVQAIYQSADKDLNARTIGGTRLAHNALVFIVIFFSRRSSGVLIRHPLERSTQTCATSAWRGTSTTDSPTPSAATGYTFASHHTRHDTHHTRHAHPTCEAPVDMSMSRSNTIAMRATMSSA
jgi:hypothetical protein